MTFGGAQSFLITIHLLSYLECRTTRQLKNEPTFTKELCDELKAENVQLRTDKISFEGRIYQLRLVNAFLLQQNSILTNKSKACCKY